MIRPAPLPAHPRVALVAPAGPLAEGAVDRALERVRGWGWEPLLGAHARGRHGYLAGTDAERLEDFQAALRSDADLIWCLRGGYGTMRLLERIDWSPLVRRPRPLIGFSDNTALHLAAQRQGVVSFHGPHPAADLPPFAEQGLFRVLRPEPAGRLPFPEGGPQRARTLAGGRAEGPLVGGNLSLLAATVGTPVQLRAQGAVLFVEEIGEASYKVDRLLSQLLLSGALHGVAGVAVGAFTDSPDLDQDGIPDAAEVLLDRLAPLGVPVAFGFPFGHVPDNWTLPLGVRARLDAERGTLELLEAAVG